MARNYKISRADRRRLNDYYGPKLESAKEEFKARTGKKIARGFSSSPESKALNRNINRAKRRAEVKYDTVNLANKLIDNRKKVTDLESKKVDGLTIITVTEKPQAFYTELSYGSGTDKEAMRQFKLAQKTGKKVRGIISNTFDGTKTYSYDEFTFNQRIQGLFQRLQEVQQGINEGNVEGASTDYPLTTTTVVESENSVSIVVQAHP